MVGNKFIYLLFVFGMVHLASSNTASASTMWLIQGKCQSSVIKTGTTTEDLGNIKGKAINCDTAVLVRLDNGRYIFNFSAGFLKSLPGSYMFGFSGGNLDMQSNKAMAILNIDTIYPKSDPKDDPVTVQRKMSTGETALKNSEGFCFFSDKNLEQSKSLSCVVKNEINNNKIIYKIEMQVATFTHGVEGKL